MIVVNIFKFQFLSEATGMIEAKLHVEPPWLWGTRVCLQGLGYITKIVTTPMYDKNPLKCLFSGTDRPMAMGLGMQHWGHGPIIICSHGDPKLASICFMARSNLAPYAFVWGKVKTLYFLGNIIDFVMNLASISHNDKRYLLTWKLCPPSPRGHPSVCQHLQTSSPESLG